jgi:FixJ family two-component response regulator
LSRGKLFTSVEVRENYFLPLRRKILLITFLLALVPFSISLYLYYSNHESLALPIFAFSGFIILVIAMLTIQYFLRRIEAIYQQKTLLNEQFIQSNKLAALGEMAAGVAHELNEPLNGFDAKTFDNALDALEELRRNTYDVLITDVKMPQMNGIELQKNVKEIDENLPVIIITGYGDVPMAVEALKNGAYDFLEKPINNEVLLASVNRAVEKRKLVLFNKNLKKEFEEAKKLRPGFQGIIGKSSQMQKIFHLIESIAKTDSTILICGETGTGKELIAKAIHNLSRRENANFLIVGTPNNAIAFAMGKDPETGERLLKATDFVKYGLPVLLLAWAVLWGWAVFGYWTWLDWPVIK